MESEDEGTGCSEKGCPGLLLGQLCPNGYGVTCGAIFPEPTNMADDPLVLRDVD